MGRLSFRTIDALIPVGVRAVRQTQDHTRITRPMTVVILNEITPREFQITEITIF